MNSIFQFHIELTGIKPAIWREVLIPADFTFQDLHLAIQISMGWETNHLYAFKIGDAHNGITIQSLHDPLGGKLDFGFMEAPEYVAEKIALSEFFKAVKDNAIYEYDFGDSWEHQVTLKKILKSDQVADALPVCIDGARRCPFEDCGGVPGYKHYCSILADRNHPDYEGILEWFGDEVPDWEYFSADEVNQELVSLKTIGKKRSATS